MNALIKVALAAGLFTACQISSQAQILSYLVDFNPDGAVYSGNPATDFGVTTSPTIVAPSVSPGVDLATDGVTATPPITYTLGTATLTLDNPYNSYQLGGTGAQALTGNFLYATGTRLVTDTLTLSGVTSGSTVDFQFIGSIQNSGVVNVSDGTTTLSQTIAPATGTGGTGTFTDVGTFTSDASTTYTITLNDGSGGGEADYSGALITINTPAAVPEPSTYAMMGLGLLVIALGLRKRSLAAWL